MNNTQRSFFFSEFRGWRPHPLNSLLRKVGCLVKNSNNAPGMVQQATALQHVLAADGSAIVHEQPQFSVSHSSFEAKKHQKKSLRPKCVFFSGGPQVKRKTTMHVVTFYGGWSKKATARMAGPN